jgi:hypothetical protein
VQGCAVERNPGRFTGAEPENVLDDERVEVVGAGSRAGVRVRQPSISCTPRHAIMAIMTVFAVFCLPKDTLKLFMYSRRIHDASTGKTSATGGFTAQRCACSC